MEPTTCGGGDNSTFLNLKVCPSRHLDDGVPGEDLMMEELRRLSSEKKMLSEKLSRVTESYIALQKRFNQLLLQNPINNSELSVPSASSRKRKAETEHKLNYLRSGTSTGEDYSFKRPKDHTMNLTPPISQVFVRTHASDPSLYVRDGYEWRKYGQKVTRDNPYPRAYFRCSFAPTCPVKKKVQRSAEEATLLVVTYEGEHNHGPRHQSQGLNDNGILEQMASSLSRDPIFTSALASALSATILHPTTLP